MIRRAEVDDIERIIQMGMRFLRSHYAEVLDDPSAEAMSATIAQIDSSPDGAIFVSEHGHDVSGFIAMMVYPHPFSGERLAGEVGWWVEPESRGIDGMRLLRRAEEWARDKGAKKIVMVSPNARVDAFYERLGYRPIERAFGRNL